MPRLLRLKWDGNILVINKKQIHASYTYVCPMGVLFTFGTYCRFHDIYRHKVRASTYTCRCCAVQQCQLPFDRQPQSNSASCPSTANRRSDSANCPTGPTEVGYILPGRRSLRSAVRPLPPLGAVKRSVIHQWTFAAILLISVFHRLTFLPKLRRTSVRIKLCASFIRRTRMQRREPTDLLVLPNSDGTTDQQSNGSDGASPGEPQGVP